MKPYIYYVVEARFWRRKIGNKLENLVNGIDFSDAYVNTKKEFRNSSPIKARKAAFNHYKSIIEVLYDGLNDEYTNDYQARIDLQYYFNSENDVELGNEIKFKVSDDLLNGIEVYMIIENPLDEKCSKTNGRYNIHGIRYIDYFDKLDDCLIDNLKNLFIEERYYSERDYTPDKEQVLKHFEPIGGEAEFYLRTPFDWDILMTQYEGKALLKE